MLKHTGGRQDLLSRPGPAGHHDAQDCPTRSGRLLIIAVFLLLAGIYSVVVPPFETPDEIWHFAFIQHVATGRGLPVSAPNTQALWRQQGVQAPGYYLAAAALTSWIDQSDFPQIYGRANPHAAIGRPDATVNRNYLIHRADEGWPWRGSMLALHISRFFSVFLGALTLWATYRALALLVGADWALLGTALCAFIPQFVFISAAASNDNGINALAALVLWRLVDMSLRASPGPLFAGRSEAISRIGKRLLRAPALANTVACRSASRRRVAIGMAIHRGAGWSRLSARPGVAVQAERAGADCAGGAGAADRISRRFKTAATSAKPACAGSFQSAQADFAVVAATSSRRAEY